MPARTLPHLTRRLLLAVSAATVFAVPALAQDTLKLGLVAAMSGQSAKSGEAIVRGLSRCDRRDQRQRRRARQEDRADRARRREQPGQGRGRGARAGAAREGRGHVRRPRYAGLARDRPVRQPEQGAVHGRVGRRHADHAQRRGRELRVPRLGGGRTGRRRARRLRGEEIRRQEARHDPDQQSMGRIEREGAESGARSQEAALCGHREVRDRRRRRGAAAHPPEAGRRRRVCSSSPTSRPPPRWSNRSTA